MSLTSPHIFYVNNTAYDLRGFYSWWNSEDGNTVLARIKLKSDSVISFNAADFLLAKQISLNS